MWKLSVTTVERNYLLKNTFVLDKEIEEKEKKICAKSEDYCRCCKSCCASFKSLRLQQYKKWDELND
jgi:hypothetical protein